MEIKFADQILPTSVFFTEKVYNHKKIGRAYLSVKKEMFEDGVTKIIGHDSMACGPSYHPCVCYTREGYLIGLTLEGGEIVVSFIYKGQEAAAFINAFEMFAKVERQSNTGDAARWAAKVSAFGRNLNVS